LLCFIYITHNVIQFHIISCCLDAMCHHKVINVRPTDRLTEYDINQYSVNTIPTWLFRPGMFLCGSSLLWAHGPLFTYCPGAPLAGWPSYWLRPARGALPLQCLRCGEIPNCPFRAVYAYVGLKP